MIIDDSRISDFWLAVIKDSTFVYFFVVKGKMGQSISAIYHTYYKSPDTSPDGFADPTYDSAYGFSGERRKRST